MIRLYNKCNSSVEVNMFSTVKKSQSNRRLLSQLDDFSQDFVFVDAAGDMQQNVVVNENTTDQENTVKLTGNKLTANENSVNFQTLEKCFTEMIDNG